jgi:hypothetical protein
VGKQYPVGPQPAALPWGFIFFTGRLKSSSHLKRDCCRCLQQGNRCVSNGDQVQRLAALHEAQGLVVVALAIFPQLATFLPNL